MYVRKVLIRKKLSPTARVPDYHRVHGRAMVRSLFQVARLFPRHGRAMVRSLFQDARLSPGFGRAVVHSGFQVAHDPIHQDSQRHPGHRSRQLKPSDGRIEEGPPQMFDRTSEVAPLSRNQQIQSVCGVYTSLRSVCSLVRPRLIRLLTVPIGRPVISAISS